MLCDQLKAIQCYFNNNNEKKNRIDITVISII